MAIDLLQDFFNTSVSTKWSTIAGGNFYITVLPTIASGYLVINRSSSTKREVIKYSAVGTDSGGNFITIDSASERGLGGTTAQTHELGESVQMNFTAEHWSDLNDALDQIVAAGAVDASVANKGIGKTSVAPVLATNPIFVGDNDERMPTADPTTLFAPLIGSINSDNVTQAADLQTQTTSTDVFEVGEADATTKKNSLAQSFIATKTKIRGFKLFKKPDLASFTGSIVITLQADNAGDPDGTPLATATITNLQWLKIVDSAEFEVLFTAEYGTLIIGDKYWIDIQPSTSDNANHPNFGGDTSGGDGTVKYNNTTDGWVTLSNSYLYYKTMEGIESQVVETKDDGTIDNSMLEGYTTVIATGTPTAILGSSVETAVVSEIIQGNKLGTTGFIRVTFWGQADDGNGTTLTIRAKYGGTTIATVVLSDDAGIADLECQFLLSAVNSATIQRGILKSFQQGETFDIDFGAATVDSTANQTLEITIEFASGVNSEFNADGRYLIELIK